MHHQQSAEVPCPVCVGSGAFWVRRSLLTPSPGRPKPVIELTANGGEIERQWRLERLQAVANQCADKGLPISQLHDHKGSLCVNWTCVPRVEQLVAVVLFWNRQAEYQSLHFANGKLLLADHESYNPFESRNLPLTDPG
jgi:hypothetical protein